MSIFSRVRLMRLSRLSNISLKSRNCGSNYFGLQVCLKSDAMINCGYAENVTIYDDYPQESLEYKRKDTIKKPKGLGVYINNDVYDEDYYDESTKMIYNGHLKEKINGINQYIDSNDLNDDDKDINHNNNKTLNGYNDYIEKVEGMMTYDWSYKYLKQFKEYAKNMSFIKQLPLSDDSNNHSTKKMDADSTNCEYDEAVTMYDCPHQQEAIKYNKTKVINGINDGVYINNDVYDEDYYLESTQMIYNGNLKKIISATSTANDNYVDDDYLNEVVSDDHDKKLNALNRSNGYNDYIEKVEGMMCYEWSFKYLKQFKEYAKNMSFIKQLHL